MFPWGWHWGYGVGLIGLILWLVLAVAIVWLIVRVVAGPRPRGRWDGPPRPIPDDPEQVLRERFARGEIDAEEYQHRLEVLRQTRPPGST